jgi:hypothetical protein
VTLPTRTCFAAMGTSIRFHLLMGPALVTLRMLLKFALILSCQALSKKSPSTHPRGVQNAWTGGWKRVVTSA